MIFIFEIMLHINPKVIQQLLLEEVILYIVGAQGTNKQDYLLL